MGRNGTRTLGFTVALGLAGAPWVSLGPARARTSWASGTAVYADPCMPAENEAVGRRVTLRRSPTGDTLIYESAALSGPVQAEGVRVDAATKALTFTVDTDGQTIRFSGTLAVDALTGVLEDEAGMRPVHLSRILRAHPDSACRDEQTGSLEPGR